MPEEEIVSLSIEEAFRFVFLIDEYRVLTANFIFDVEGVYFWIPIFVRFGNSPKDDRKTATKSNVYLN